MVEKLGALNGPKIFLKMCKQLELIKNEVFSEERQFGCKQNKAVNSCWISLYPSFKDNQEERASGFCPKMTVDLDRKQ